MNKELGLTTNITLGGRSMASALYSKAHNSYFSTQISVLGGVCSHNMEKEHLCNF